MSFKEVKELRQSNNLADAYTLAKEDLLNGPEDIWNKRSLAWVLYDYLKINSTEEQYELFIKYLKELKELDLPENENMIYDNSAWQIGKLIFDINKSQQIDYNKIDQLFSVINVFHFSKPSEAFSFLFKAFHKGYKNWHNYLSFADWWDFDNFREDDYKKEEFNGRSIMSIAEQAYIGYSKKLIERLDTCNVGFAEYDEYESIKNKIIAFIPKLDKIIIDHPDYQYPQYFKVKLQLAIGDRNNLLNSFIPFARQKRNDFWVWELLSEIFSNDETNKLACLCKALSCKSPNDFLVRVREHFVDLLIPRKDYTQAKYEIEEIIKTRNENNWKIPQKIQNWTKEDWFIKTELASDNKYYYKKYIPIAEAILFEDVPEEIVVVEHVNSEKKILNFIASKTKHGYFKYDKQIDDVQIGDFLRVKFVPENNTSQTNTSFNSYETNHKHYKVLALSKTNEIPRQDIIKNFEGIINIRDEQKFGFVEDIFIEPNLIKSFNINNNDLINGLALISFNKKKNEWSYKAVRINKLNRT